MSEAKPLQRVIGEQLRVLRGDQLRQEDVVELVRSYGLNWRRSTVDAIEAGTRSVSLEELLLLCMVFQRPLVWWVAGDLVGVKRDEKVRLTAGAAAPMEGVANLLRGKHPHDLETAQPRTKRALGLDVRDWDVEAADSARALDERFAHERARLSELWPDADDHDRLAVSQAARRDAEMKAARRLGITPFDVAVLAVSHWGRGLSEEREHRVARESTDELEARSVQAIRGHVTRTLLAELAQVKEEKGL